MLEQAHQAITEMEPAAHPSSSLMGNGHRLNLFDGKDNEQSRKQYANDQCQNLSTERAPLPSHCRVRDQGQIERVDDLGPDRRASGSPVVDEVVPHRTDGEKDCPEEVTDE